MTIHEFCLSRSRRLIYKKLFATTVSANKTPPKLDKATGRPKGVLKIVQSSRTPSTPINARNQCTRAIRKLDKKLRGDHAVAATVPAPSPGDGSSLLPKALKETAFESARFHEAAERKEVEEITSASAEKQREADTKSSCYFEAHAQALEAFIAFDTQGNEDPASLDDEGGELLRLEYE